MRYLDTSYARIDWDPSIRCVLIEWRDFSDGVEYRGANDKVLEILGMKGANKILADTRNMKVVSPADQEWLAKEWTPRSRQAGLKYSAVVIPRTAVGTMTLGRMVNRGMHSKSKFVPTKGLHYFEDVEEAKKWLRSLPNH